MAVFDNAERPERRSARSKCLKGVSLKVEKGEVVSIIGPSGGGKSTMLRCATLLETMDSGTLAYGENVAAREERRQKRLRRTKPRSRRCGGSSGWCSSSLTSSRTTQC